MPVNSGTISGPATIAVVGCGVIGLPTALLLARAGYQVIGVDIDEHRLKQINDWQLPYVGPSMRAVIADAGTRERLSAQKEMPAAEVYIIAAPTPLKPGTRECDLSAVITATKAVAQRIQAGGLVILESTVPPQTCTSVIAPLLQEHGLVPGEAVHLAFCPERVMPGRVYHELIHNDRVIGGLTPACAEAALAVYKSFVKGELITTDCTTAELCKLTENTFRDICIAFANEMSQVAEQLGVDQWELIKLANLHPRVSIPWPGIGVGGHCLPIDPYFIVQAAPEHSSLIHAARQINDRMPQVAFERIRTELACVSQPKVVGFGVTYKPDTPDTRESPALVVWQLLRDAGFDLTVYDPLVAQYSYDSFAEAVEGADFVIVLVPHKEVLSQIRAHQELLAANGTQVLMLGHIQKTS